MMVAQPNLKILTPAYMGNLTTIYFHGMLNFASYAMGNGIPFSVETLPNCSLISLGRNIMLGRVMKDPDWTHIMWIDSDIEFSPECIHSMILDDKPIIGGFYPKKGLPVDFASSPMPNGEDTETSFETDYVATGFMLIKREVVEAMMEAYPERKFKYQDELEFYDLFSPYIDHDNGSLYLTEDYAFCKLARAIGYKSYMSKRFVLGHHGVFTFSRDREKEILAAYESAGHIEIKKEALRG